MASQVDIYNLSLNHLGMREVSSITEDTPSVDALNTFYQPCLDDLFGEYKWPFATVKAALVSATDTTAELEWSYIYVRPTAAATVWYVYNESTLTTKDEQEFEVIYQSSTNRRLICSNLETAYAEYTHKLSDTTLYSPKFVLALSYKLAASCAGTLLRDIKTGSQIMEMATMYIQEAKRIGFSEKRKKITPTSSYKSAR